MKAEEFTAKLLCC